MKSCGSILIGGAILLAVVIFATGDASNYGGFLFTLVIMGAIGIAIVRSSATKKTSSRPLTAAPQRATAALPASTPGWSLTERADTWANEWKNHPVLPGSGLWQVRSGRAHRREVTVFQSARGAPAPTFMVFRIPEYDGPLFDATSDGRSEISVRGTMVGGLSEMLTSIGPRTFRRLGTLPNRLFWLDVGVMSEQQVTNFISRQVPSIVETVNKHLTAGKAGATSASNARPPQQQRAAAQRPAQQQRPAPQQQRPAAPRPAQQRPVRSTPQATRPHDRGLDPDDIMQTPPIEVHERPALKPAAADPISAGLEHPDLSTITTWKPVEWAATPFELTAPMGLGEIPSAVDQLSTGWKPREWVAPTYGANESSEWKPAEAWQPNYTTSQND